MAVPTATASPAWGRYVLNPISRSTDSLSEFSAPLLPNTLLAPYWRDRHPDHSAAGQIVRNCALCCTLTKSNSAYPPHKPRAFLYYLLHHFRKPSFVVDISPIYARKLELLKLHSSQFSKTADELGLAAHGMSDYLFGLESRDRYFGSLIGKHHAEALVSDRPIGLASLGKLFNFVVLAP